MASAHPRSRGLLLIAAFKLLKGIALLAIGIGALKLLHKDLETELARWVDLLPVDPDNPYLQKLMDRLSQFDARKLKHLSIGTFFYAGLVLVEGGGLFFGKRWAEYFTIIITTSFIPLECYELSRRVTPIRAGVLLVNVIIVIYLIMQLRRAPTAEVAVKS
jgi:uncharacterized membrane protein (DUF2068 family)